MSNGNLILLADDIPDHIAAYGTRLAERGFRVRVARTGREALDLMKQARPDCAAIDLRLPDMSGWDLCREMKSQHGCRDMPVIVLTPDVSPATLAESSRAQCNAWLAHPTVAEDLVRTVRRVLELDCGEPASLDAAVIGTAECVACGSAHVRPTVRLSPIQYYSCRACGFFWRTEALETAATPAR